MPTTWCGLCSACGEFRSSLSREYRCEECREPSKRVTAFAEFLLRFDREQPKIPTILYPEYREWIAWAQEIRDDL